VGAKRLKERIGFPPYAFRERFVSHGVLARGLKLIPQALNEGQTSVPVI
jgi:hypothetical protein